MAKRKPGQPKAAKASVDKVVAVSRFEKNKRLMSKYRTWAFIIWVIGLMLILAKWGKFGWIE